MKIVIPGGSGQVGTMLARHFAADEHEVVVLSRRPRAAAWRMATWDAESAESCQREIDGADVVINLAGRSVNCRYGARNRREILESRIRSTRAVGEAIRRAATPPKVWLQASTATIYAHRFDADNDEASGILGGAEPAAPDTWRFSIDVAKAWEQAAREADVPHTRRVLMRSAMTMSPDRGGVFDTLLRLVRFGLGGASGDGRQFVSWIHEDDFVRAIEWLIDDERLEDVVNLASPHPLPNVEFMRLLRTAWGGSIGLPATHWMLEVGAFILRTESELVLKSRRVVPGRLIQAGFCFNYPYWEAAAKELCQRWRLWHGGRKASATVHRQPMIQQR
jgi:uncharacterized protein (TIGR01777 family)